MVEVADKPILHWQLEALEAIGISRVTVACRKAQLQPIDDYCRTIFTVGAFGRASVEEEPLGTGGAIYNAIMNSTGMFSVDAPFLVLNGDIIPGPWLKRLAEWPQGKGLAAIGVRWQASSGPYGAVDIHFDGRIRGFREPSEESKRTLIGDSGYINTGVYWMDPAIFDEIDFSATIPCSLERDIFPVLAEHGELWAKNCVGPWCAVDTPADVLRVSRELAGQ
jgi:NDP-sugar pyrophosphorylase family protein